jgi:hypothetical protein
MDVALLYWHVPYVCPPVCPSARNSQTKCWAIPIQIRNPVGAFLKGHFETAGKFTRTANWTTPVKVINLWTVVSGYGMTISGCVYRHVICLIIPWLFWHINMRLKIHRHVATAISVYLSAHPKLQILVLSCLLTLSQRAILEPCENILGRQTRYSPKESYLPVDRPQDSAIWI